MMACIRCQSDRIAQVSAKCSDLCSFIADGNDHHGYVPGNVRIGGGDYVEFRYCLNCGCIQDEFPVPEETIQRVFGED